MMNLRVRNVNDAYSMGLWALKEEGEEEETRNGKVKVFPTPITTMYSNPNERVLFDVDRDANPFFHLAECIWILAGSKRLDWIQHYNRNMASFSDDGETLEGAYGYRLREYFGYDQIIRAIDMLRRNPHDRRVVLSMWDTNYDLGRESKDVPCNTTIYLRRRKTELNMMVTCRSNDIIWGAYGANAVHFGFLHEYLAWAVGARQGMLTQVSWNYHIYEPHWPLMERSLINEENPYDHHDTIALDDGHTSAKLFRDECENLVEFGASYTPQNFFLKHVVRPMMLAWDARKLGKDPDQYLNDMPKCDWRAACKQWVNSTRRMANVSER